MKLPPYTVRVSSRARRVRLVIRPDQGLTVVAPAWFDLDRLEPLVADRLDWIAKHLGPDWTAPAAPRCRPAFEPPAEVRLTAVGRLVRVRYRAGDAPGVRVAGLGEALEVRGAIADREAVAAALRTWLVREARAQLGPWLRLRAEELGLDFSGLGVRLQRTRWGSCSAKGVINLNAALLFLPRPLTAYVLDHELAHLRHLNHSKAYWSLLESLHPGCRAADRAMREARDHVPAWANRP